MDYLDKYAEQQRRQNLGYTCEYCDSAAGHRVSCFLLNTPSRLTGQNFKEDKYRTIPTRQVYALNPSHSLEEALARVLATTGRNISKQNEPTQADHDSLLGPCGISWNGDNRE